MSSFTKILTASLLPMSSFRVGKVYTFTAAPVNSDPTLSIVSYTWDFGDGTTGTGASVTHTYSINNPYIVVKLTILDSRGRSWYGWQPLPL